MNKTTDYIGNMIYENGALKRILIDGGYIEGGVYYYYLNDHQGNNRLVADANGVVVQKNHYYPFGMSFADGLSPSAQPYKYNGKELDQMHGLNQYDYAARYYDPSFARFTTVDPMAEKYPGISPYAYCKNNPVNRIDPKGEDDFFYNQQGVEINHIKTKNLDNFYLEHADGNVTIGDKTYYQGASKESFFGDRGNEKLEMFEKIDKVNLTKKQNKRQ